MQKFNILYIEDTIGLGGSIISLCHLLQYLNKNRYNAYSVLYHTNQELYMKYRCDDVNTIVAKPMDSFKSSAIGVLLIRFLKTFGKGGKRFGNLLIYFADFIFSVLPFAIKVCCKVRKYNIDFVHLNTGVCIPGIVITKLLKVPCIATQRGPEWKSPIIGFFSNFITFFMANSQATKKGLIDMGVTPAKISVVYPPVDLKNFDFNLDSHERKKEFNISSDEYTFGILGNIWEGKGHKIVLQATAEVLNVFPKCKLFIIGDTPDSNDDDKVELIRMADKLGIRSKVIFTGFRKDVPELIQILDIVIHASLFPEPFGKVIIEGMAMKKPVIATLGGGTSEIIDNGINGFLVPPNDYKILSETIIAILKDSALREKIGNSAYKKVKKFDIEHHIKEVEKVYESLLTM